MKAARLALIILLLPAVVMAQKPAPSRPPPSAADTKPEALAPTLPRSPVAQTGPAAPPAPAPAAAPSPAAPLAPAGAFEAYRAAFSAATLPPGAGAGTVIGWSLHYRGAMPHAAFVIAAGPDGRVLRWRYLSGRSSPEDARREALTICENQDRTGLPPGTTCRILATDLAPEGRPAVMTPRTDRLGPFRASPFHWRHGPERAAGVLLWSHGYGGREVDSRNSPTPGFLSALNDAGWDVFRFDRSPLEDELAVSLATLQRAVPLLRQAGYRRVVLGGQSRGAWQSLLVAGEQPEAVDGVIAAAPAAHGATAASQGAALDDFRRLLAGLPVARMRVAIALFDEDPYDPDLAGRSALVEQRTTQRTAPTLLLRPEAPIKGHGGATDVVFTQRYAACLMTLLQAPEAAAPRGLRRAACGGG